MSLPDQPSPSAPPPFPPASGAATPAADGTANHGPAVPRWFLTAAVLFLMVIAGLAYQNSLHTDFALDNALVIGQDTRLRTWKWEEIDPETRTVRPELSLVFTEGYWFPNFPSDLYRPLTTITYAFNWSGPDLAGNRGLKALLYCVGAGVAFLIARQFTRRWWAALLLAAAAVLLLPLLPWSLTHNGPDPTAPPGSSGQTQALSTYGFHVTNLLLHLINVTLVLVIARRITQRPWLALLAAAIFAVHPAETESVTNVVGRADELSTMWILTAFWCYLRAIATDGIKDSLWRLIARLLWLGGMMLAATAGMFSKESGVMIGLLVPLYDFIFRWPGLTGRFWERVGKAGWEFFAKGWVAMIPAALFFLIIRAGMIEETPTYGQLFIDNPISRVPAELSLVTEEHKLNVIEKAQTWAKQLTFSGELTAFKVQGRYLGLLAYPDTLACDYSYNAIPLYGEAGSSLWENLQCWISLGVVLGLLATAWFRRLSSPLFSFGVFFFFAMMLPTANVLFPIGSIMGERFLYLPSIGFCLVAALGLRLAGEKLAALAVPAEWRLWAGLGLPLVVLCALGIRTYARNADWQSEFSLWKSAVAAQPNSFKVHKGLANGYWNRTNGFDAAIREAGLDDAIARAEVGLAVLNEHPLPTNRQDNTLFCDLGMYYNLKARFLSDPNRKAGAVPAEAAKFWQKGVDVMIRARTVDSWVNLASRGSKLQRGTKLADINDVGNPRVHNQLAEAYLGLNSVHIQMAAMTLDQIKIRLLEAAAASQIWADKETDLLKAAQYRTQKENFEGFAKSAQLNEAQLIQAQKTLRDIAALVTGADKARYEEAAMSAQVAVGWLNSAAMEIKEAATAAAYSRHLGPNQSVAYLLLGTAQFNDRRPDAAALTLLEALVLDPGGTSANEGFWGGLKSSYEAMGQKDAIIDTPIDLPNGQKGVQHQLNVGNKFVRDQMAQASTEIIQLLIAAKDLNNAKFFRQLTLNRYSNLIPESVLPPEPEVKPKLTFGGRLKQALRSLLPSASSPADTGKK